MEHKPLKDLSHVADLLPETPKCSMNRRERLERWIQVLNREPGRALRTLHEAFGSCLLVRTTRARLLASLAAAAE
jgi:hypothetical protein